MRKVLLAALLFCLCLLPAGCNTGGSGSDVMDEIRNSPVVKLEFAGRQDAEPVFSDNAGTTASIADMRVQAPDGEFDEEWIYRFTYNPQEKVIDGNEIVVLFGESSMSVDGVKYLPEDGVDYGDILQWAEGAYDCCAG